MTTAPRFDVDVAQNPHLARGADAMDAIVNVTAHPGLASDAAGRPSAAEVILLDCSASMFRPSKFAAAKAAACAAVDSMRDGTAFAIVAGSEGARMVYPARVELAEAGSGSRAAAKQAVGQVTAGGGTAMSHWLRTAADLFADQAPDLRHAILLTDGRNTSEAREELSATLDDLRDTFTCDCRGVGTDWEVAELRQIADALLGTVDIVAEPADLAADFAAMTRRAMSKAVPDVALRLWTPKPAAVARLRQVNPTVAELTGHAVPGDPQAADYPTGSWGPETRAYHLRVSMRAAGVGETMLACRVRAVDATGTPLGEGRVIATWTDDSARYGALDPQVAHYTGQVELASTIQQGLEARRAGDDRTATHKLGRAVAIAAESGHGDTMRLLSKVVDVHDARRGLVRLKPSVAMLDEMTLDTRSVVTARLNDRA